ncbi:peroxidase/cytochrome P450 family protein [Aspergillus stella-maris]|uniref:peroxidase/cytochrome P450 family protein n=1 Tax=Aspergillus stella-maris TaxID=1810926 RepID=UPI003CCDCF01
MSMLRRFSTFKKGKGDKAEKADGESKKVNGSHANGTTPTKDNSKRQSRVSAPPRRSSSDSGNSAESDDIPPVFEKYAQVLHASSRPVPHQGGEAAYLEKEHPSGLFNDLKSLGLKDYSSLKDVIKTKINGELTDDKTMIMERVIQIVSSLPSNSKIRADLTNVFLDELWGSLPHPPLSYMGPEYAYRSADGSNNNPTLPWLGAANTAYSRSIEPLTVQPGGLPDAGLVFDTLFARQKFTPHPNKVSSLFFDWASLIIHDIFQTDYRDYNKNKTSAYLDLAILYGDVKEEQDLVRTHKDGKLKPDAFSEPRLQAFPAACCVLLVMLNRFHNFVVEELAAINENGRFTKPDPNLPAEQAEKAWAKRDEDLFQTGRLVTCGLFINITLYDYLRTIVNLNRVNSTWCLDPRAQMEGGATPAGLGNQCSVEFNLAYRWHSAISANDEKWTEQVYEELIGKPGAEISTQELLMGLGKYGASLPKDPSQRTFAGLKRQEDGTFKDEELVGILTLAIEDVAGSFGARNVPKVLKAVEVLGIEQGRKWQVGSLNEFRKFFGLKNYETFEEINSNPEVAESLRSLYGHPDYVELYPGIVSEEAKEPMVPGVGIAPCYTISRAVLSDAVALVRGDRHYTTDYNARNLTNWGYNEVRYDLNINQGCVFYKLATRAFPNWFKPDSIYAHYPMTIPSENKVIMKDLGREADYSWDKPQFQPSRVSLTSYANVKLVLDQQKDFPIVWGDCTPLKTVKGGEDFWSKTLSEPQWKQSIKDFYTKTTLELLADKSTNLAGRKQVDIVRDVGNVVPARFASKLLSLPIKNKQNPKGIFTDHEIFTALAVIYTAIFFDADPTKAYTLRRAADAVSQEIGKQVESHVKSVSSPGFLSRVIDNFRDDDSNALSELGDQLIKKLSESGLSTSDITFGQILPTAVETVHGQAQMYTRVIDYYINEGKQYLPAIELLAKSDSAESDARLTRYVLEAIRLNGGSGVFRKAQTNLYVKEGDLDVNLKPGDEILLGSNQANRDPTAFPDPESVRLDRPDDSYLNYGVGSQVGLGKEATLTAVTAMVRASFSVNNLRPAPGPQGILKKVERPDGYTVYMREDYGAFSPYPTTFRVHFDGQVPTPKKQVSA